MKQRSPCSAAWNQQTEMFSCESYEDNIEGLTVCIMDYISFCVDNNIPSGEIQCSPNNKPWVTSSLKVLIKQK